jgi:hypothetical protein
MKQVVKREGNRVLYQYPSRGYKDPDGNACHEYEGGRMVWHVLDESPPPVGPAARAHQAEVALAGKLAEVGEELERLRAEVGSWQRAAKLAKDSGSSARRDYAAAADEVERLRGELDSTRKERDEARRKLAEATAVGTIARITITEEGAEPEAAEVERAHNIPPVHPYPIGTRVRHFMWGYEGHVTHYGVYLGDGDWDDCEVHMAGADGHPNFACKVRSLERVDGPVEDRVRVTFLEPQPATIRHARVKSEPPPPPSATMTSVCLAESAAGFLCNRDKGHSGSHSCHFEEWP